jgi:hypothetical protein
VSTAEHASGGARTSTAEHTSADGVGPAGESWTREQWAALADRMLLAVRPHASPGHAQIVLPGAVGGYGRAVDGLEGFARTFLLAGFRLAGERGADPLGLAQWYADGLAAGTDPTSSERWVRLEEHGQAKVEAASLALVLDLTRPWIWDRLDPAVQANVVDYLAPAVGDDTYPRINWVWFRLVVQTFLRSVGGTWSREEMLADLATHDSFVRPGGWLADGAERSFDHYAGWALHTYPTLWSRMAGAHDLAAERGDTDARRLDRFLADAVDLVGADGSPLLQGRSLIYRFAAAAPYWVGAMAEVPSVPPGMLRRAASRMVEHFAAHGAPDERGLLTLGWHHPWPRLAQSYSGPGSPYWASKGMLGLALPADHPVWTAPEVLLPLETTDRLRAVRAPGWLVTGTRADGIVRVVNHGTDHALEGSRAADSPLYARLGYSTATAPLLDDASWADPVDQSVVLVAGDGRRSHRTGMTVLDLGPVGEAAPDGVSALVAASRAHTHWVTPEETAHRHGSGLSGEAEDAGTVLTVSVVRGAWEVRLVVVEEAADGARAVEIGGWPLAGAEPPAATEEPGGATVSSGRLVSRVIGLAGVDGAAVVRRRDASPLGTHAAVPMVRAAVTVGEPVAVAVALTGEVAGPDLLGPPTLEQHGSHIVVRWHDGARTSLVMRAITAGAHA